MGRGNVCVNKPYEGLFYIDNEDITVYREDEPADGMDPESRLLRDLEYADLQNWHWDEISSSDEEEEVVADFMSSFLERFRSFTEVAPKEQWISRTQRAILENKLFYVALEDNEWSLAVELLQKEAPYDDSLSGLQKRHYQKYLDGIRDSLLETLPSIGIYKGAWTSGVLTKKDIENIA